MRGRRYGEGLCCVVLCWVMTFAPLLSSKGWVGTGHSLAPSVVSAVEFPSCLRAWTSRRGMKLELELETRRRCCKSEVVVEIGGVYVRIPHPGEGLIVCLPHSPPSPSPFCPSIHRKLPPPIAPELGHRRSTASTAPPAV